MTAPEKPAAPMPAASAGTSVASMPGHAVVRVHSEQLFAGAQEVQIVHQGGVYRLKQTALGKLILTK